MIRSDKSDHLLTGQNSSLFDNNIIFDQSLFSLKNFSLHKTTRKKGQDCVITQNLDIVMYSLCQEKQPEGRRYYLCQHVYLIQYIIKQT